MRRGYQAGENVVGYLVQPESMQWLVALPSFLLPACFLLGCSASFDHSEVDGSVRWAATTNFWLATLSAFPPLMTLLVWATIVRATNLARCALGSAGLLHAEAAEELQNLEKSGELNRFSAAEQLQWLCLVGNYAAWVVMEIFMVDVARGGLRVNVGGVVLLVIGVCALPICRGLVAALRVSFVHSFMQLPADRSDTVLDAAVVAQLVCGAP